MKDVGFDEHSLETCSIQRQKGEALKSLGVKTNLLNDFLDLIILCLLNATLDLIQS